MSIEQWIMTLPDPLRPMAGTAAVVLVLVVIWFSLELADQADEGEHETYKE